MIQKWDQIQGIQKKQKENKKPQNSQREVPVEKEVSADEIAKNLKEMYEGFLGKEEAKQQLRVKSIQDSLKQTTDKLSRELDMFLEKQNKKNTELEHLTMMYLWLNSVVEDCEKPLASLKLPKDMTENSLKEILGQRYLFV
jgi:hypothetical protein